MNEDISSAFALLSSADRLPPTESPTERRIHGSPKDMHPPRYLPTYLPTYLLKYFERQTMITYRLNPAHESDYLTKSAVNLPMNPKQTRPALSPSLHILS